jgi:hypothetical protein
VSLIQDYDNECACKAYGENHKCENILAENLKAEMTYGDYG